MKKENEFLKSAIIEQQAFDLPFERKSSNRSSPIIANSLTSTPSQINRLSVSGNYFKSPQVSNKNQGSVNKWLSPQNPSYKESLFSRVSQVNSTFDTPNTSRYDPDGTAKFVQNYPNLSKSLSKTSLVSDLTLVTSQNGFNQSHLSDHQSNNSFKSNFSEIGVKVSDAFPHLFNDQDNYSRNGINIDPVNSEVEENTEIVVLEQTEEVENDALLAIPFPKLNRLSTGIAEDRVKKSYVFKIIGSESEITLDHVKTIWADYIVLLIFYIYTIIAGFYSTKRFIYEFSALGSFN